MRNLLVGVVIGVLIGCLTSASATIAMTASDLWFGLNQTEKFYYVEGAVNGVTWVNNMTVTGRNPGRIIPFLSQCSSLDSVVTRLDGIFRANPPLGVAELTQDAIAEVALCGGATP